MQEPICEDIETGAGEFAPDDNWIAELEAQLTPTLIDSLRNYARMRAFAVAIAGRKVDDYYARELVQDAIGDTWSGLLCWEPARCTLEHHLIRAIQSRTDKHRKQAKASPHDALGDATTASRAAEVDASSLVADPDHAAQRVYSRETMAVLRARLVGDKQAFRVLAAYEAGATKKADVLAFTGMKERTYNNAHARLKRIVRTLTDHQLAPKARA